MSDLAGRLGAVVLCAALSGPLSVQAEQALVMTQDAAGLEIGQAFLAHYGAQCYAIMPTHVAREASRPALLEEGSPPLLGEATSWSDLGDDIGIALVNGAVESRCGPGGLTIQRSVERLLQQGRLGTLRRINGDGSVAQLPVTIFDDDGKAFLRVQPTRPDSAISKGQSGSQLMIDGVAVGMLLSVSAGTGVGKVVRIDRVMAKVDSHLMDRSSWAASGQSTVASLASRPGDMAAEPARSGQSLRVVAWNSLPATVENRAINLVANDDSPPWISEARRWPVTLDFEGSGKVITVRGLVLDGAGVTNSGQLPNQVEVSINLSGDPSAWRSIVSTRLDYRLGVARIDFAPMRARMIRLSFSGTANGGNVLTLRRVSLPNE